MFRRISSVLRSSFLINILVSVDGVEWSLDINWKEKEAVLYTGTVSPEAIEVCLLFPRWSWTNVDCRYYWRDVMQTILLQCSNAPNNIGSVWCLTLRLLVLRGRYDQLALSQTACTALDQDPTKCLEQQKLYIQSVRSHQLLQALEQGIFSSGSHVKRPETVLRARIPGTEGIRCIVCVFSRAFVVATSRWLIGATMVICGLDF